ncbi:MAG TPA: hypothetical protein VIG39_11230 [Rhizomicrobium sp.]|jgi:hypothetical protein
MHQYEIRILRNDGSTAIIAADLQLDDDAAIRSARRIARGRRFEVWRGMDCIQPAAAPIQTEPVKKTL